MSSRTRTRTRTIPNNAHLGSPDPFLWATGIEDTFITDPWPATGRTLEEYELTQHYRFWRDDFQRIAERNGEGGVGSARKEARR